ncbi:MAG: hypothetical protein ABGW69_01200 [Nanoarchaeota archaeon]
MKIFNFNLDYTVENEIKRINLTIPEGMYRKIEEINSKLGNLAKSDSENIRNFLSLAVPLVIKEFKDILKER